ncbi:hypothetical protein FRB95_005834 [Tulasnella sp. JGI-2019a]|nr:hypothetical protein FRB95_005834 [Tulasnella sp. JGI-2019a]
MTCKKLWLLSHYDSELMKSHFKVFSLGEEKEEAEKDIEAFSKKNLPELVESSAEKASDLPGEEQQKILMHQPQGPFILMSTISWLVATNLSFQPYM